jgi:hypothetical protein
VRQAACPADAMIGGCWNGQSGVGLKKAKSLKWKGEEKRGEPGDNLGGGGPERGKAGESLESWSWQ